jgi:hypothetical protein
MYTLFRRATEIVQMLMSFLPLFVYAVNIGKQESGHNSQHAYTEAVRAYTCIVHDPLTSPPFITDLQSTLQHQRR